ncbi:deoxynucleotidyltransferase terminal-interacting protein 2 [Osmerus mordax]|uniref:deoxynucleotidyltransferase terminal-interacting protein 2 n=1 Tax=Osmerus mordax TaxID=8014 RepID=UPI00350F23A5
MVATRRGGRACSPTKSNSDESADVSATPSSCRRTGRRTANREQTASQLPVAPVGADGEEGVPATPLQDQSSTVKRRTRASRLQSHRLESTHEADVSDSESCCSAASDVDHPILRRGRRKTPGRSSNPCVDLSDVDSCSSATSVSRVGPLARHGTKRAAGSGQSDSIPVESEEEGKDSCGSAVSDTQRVTRSLRRSAIARSLASRRAEDAGDVSEGDSCASSLSAAPSSSRRPARGRTGRPAQPIPMHLEEASDLPRSPTPSRRTRTPVADPGAWDSEGFESGPSVTPRRSTRKRTAHRYACSGTTDSDDSLNVSPSVSASRGRGIPCSSSSSSSSKAVSVTRLSVVVERTVVSVTEERRRGLEEKTCHLGKVSVSQGAEGESVLEDSKLDATIGPEDVTLTLEEEKEEEEEVVINLIDLIDQEETDAPQGFCLAEESQRGSVIVSGEAHVEESEAASEPLPSQADTQAVCGPAVGADDQQRGQSHSAASTEEDVGAMIQDTEAGPEPELRPGDTAGVTVCYVPVTEGEEGCEEEAMDVAASSRAHSPELHVDVCHLVLSEEEGELEKVLVEGKAQRGEVVVVEEEQEEVVLEEGKAWAREGVVVVLDEEEEEKAVAEEQKQKEVVVLEKEVLEEKHQEKEVMLEEEEDMVEEKKQEEVVVIDQEEEDVVVLEEQQQEDVLVERKEAQVAVLKEQEEVAEEENQEEVNVVIEKKVDSVLVVMEEEEMEVSVSAPEALEAGSEAAILPPQPPQPLLPDSIQVNSSQQLKVVVSEVTEQPHDSIIVQKAKVVSLLDSSEDEDEEESGHEEEEEDNEDLAGPSQSVPVSDGLFVIDTRPDQRDGRFYQETQEEAATAAEDEEEFVDEDGDDEEDDDDRALFTIKSQNAMELSSRIDTGLRARELGGLYVCFDGGKPKSASSNDPQKKKQKSDDQVMKKSVIGPEFEKQDAVPPYSESKQASKLKRKAEREKTTGDGWFNMRAPEMTTELKGDLKALKMRAAMDPKRFYKKNDRDGFPKYFQMGTVADSAVDFYHSRIPKKDRKRTMVEELLADAEFRHTNKKKYQQIMTEKAALGSGRKRNRFLKKKKK